MSNTTTKQIADAFKNRNKVPGIIEVKNRIPKHRREELRAICKRMRAER